ncbi:MAG TPA: FAD-dependent oxidoreductase [Methanocella sp.]
MAAEPQMQQPGMMNVETHLEKVVPRTQDVKSFVFPRPGGFDYKAGQWMYVNIRIEGVTKMHHFTISSSPTEDYIMFTKKITDSPYSKALDTYKGGEWFRLWGPFGEFTFSGEYPKLGFLSGGIGITPLRSILRYIVDKKLPTDVKMLYANKTEADIVFKEELEQMQQQGKNIKIGHVLTRQPDWKGLKGHVTAQMIKEQMPDYQERVFYICGPPGMNAALSKELKALGMPDDKIKLEDFTGYE